MRFLHSSAFLLGQFRLEGHWFSLVPLFRNALIAVAPYLPTVARTVAFLIFVLLVSTVLTRRAARWRSYAANYLDVVLNAAMLAITGIGASFAEEADYDGAAWVICCFFGLSLLVLMCAAAFGIHARFGRKASFSFFISHHKAGEGALARQLQMQLADNPCTRGRVFIDSDELQNLDTLFEYAQREW